MMKGTEKQIRFATDLLSRFTNAASNAIEELTDMIADWQEELDAGNIGVDWAAEIVDMREAIKVWEYALDAIRTEEDASVVIDKLHYSNPRNYASVARSVANRCRREHISCEVAIEASKNSIYHF